LAGAPVILSDDTRIVECSAALAVLHRAGSVSLFMADIVAPDL
jgi:hypothetical protein